MSRSSGFQVPLSCRSPLPLSFRAPRCFFATSYPQRRVPKSPCQKPSNSSQNRSKRRRFPSKRDQKSAHFVMPILTFWGLTPSGASARAVLAFRKGKKARFGGAKWPPEKLSTIAPGGGYITARRMLIRIATARAAAKTGTDDAKALPARLAVCLAQEGGLHPTELDSVGQPAEINDGEQAPANTEEDAVLQGSALVRPARFERATFGFEVRDSIH